MYFVPTNFVDPSSDMMMVCQRLMPFGDHAAAPLVVGGWIRHCQQALSSIQPEMRDCMERTLTQSTYVDDIFTRAKTEDELLKLVEVVDELLK